MKLKGQKVLITFFSRAGENFSKGQMVQLERGNTFVVANTMKDLIDADIFEIKAVEEYPAEYKACVQRAIEESKTDARPAIKDDIDISGYDIIIVGYPNWCGTMPKPVWTFIENHDFTGKTIMPFITHEGSGLANSVTDLKKLAPSANVVDGLAVNGTEKDAALEDIKAWLNK